ncbi:MAG: DUF547 domain-containing protein [Pseudomonadota bacterium]
MNKYLTTFVMIFIVLFSINSHAYLDQLDGLLGTHLNTVTKNNIQYNGVDYDAWHNDPRHAEVLNNILNTNPDIHDTREDKLAFWINTYNVLTIDLINKENERETIKNLGGFFSSPWKKFKWTIAGKSYTLDEIEHEIIRPLGEPRIHFAINCAAKSCPDLRAESYRADQLEEQLAEQTRLTFDNQTKGLQYKDNQVTLTKVMDWFKEDFNEGNLLSWLKYYYPENINDQTSIRFFDYDWSLNKQ